MKKIASLVLAVCMLLTVISLVSCGENPTPEKTTPSQSESTTANTPSGSTEPSQSTQPTSSTQPSGSTDTPVIDVESNDGYSKLAGYLDVDFGDADFVFVTTDGSDGVLTYPEVFVETRDGGTIVDTAVYDRNVIMKKLYNCNVKAVMGSGTLIANDIATGSSDYDFLLTQYSAFSNGGSMNYLNFLELGIDFDLPGWNKAFIEQCSCTDNNGVNKLFSIDGDFAISSIGDTWTMAVNLDLYNQNFDESIFDIVSRKEWTVDKLMEMCAAVARDNGDSEWKVGDDVFGLVSTAHNPIGLLTGVGFQFVQKNAQGQLYTSSDVIKSNGAAEKFDKLHELCTMDSVDNNTSYTIVANTLADGKALFIGQVMDVICSNADRKGLADSGINYAPIPEPLYAAGEDYRSYVNDKSANYFVSKNAAEGDKERIAD
ncbi:MAG: hypothetical protein KBS59_00140, partial [Clostridiales bacterium]|nr:hypothetical protein [Clostridiales bacterium]